MKKTEAESIVYQCAGRIAVEMVRAVAEHGPLTDDPVRACAILTEEVGEAVAEALSLTRRNPRMGAKDDLISELLQVAAVAVMMIKDLDHKE